jgi:hypothetical protein
MKLKVAKMGNESVILPLNQDANIAPFFTIGSLPAAADTMERGAPGIQFEQERQHQLAHQADHDRPHGLAAIFMGRSEFGIQVDTSSQ